MHPPESSQPPPTRWTVTADDSVSDASDPTVGLAMDLDPRAASLRLGVRILSGGTPDIRCGAIYRRFFPGAVADWGRALRWLASPEAALLLDAVLGGYEAELLWSGDWYTRWSPGALDAAQRLHAGIEARLLP